MVSDRGDLDKAIERDDAVVLQLRRDDPEADPAEGFAAFVTHMAKFTRREVARRLVEVADQTLTDVATESLFGLVVDEAKRELFTRAALAVAEGGEAAGRQRLTMDLFDIITNCSRFDDPFATGVLVARREAALDIIRCHPGLELDSRELWNTLRTPNPRDPVE
jgi:hypothetical protein